MRVDRVGRSKDARLINIHRCIKGVDYMYERTREYKSLCRTDEIHTAVVAPAHNQLGNQVPGRGNQRSHQRSFGLSCFSYQGNGSNMSQMASSRSNVESHTGKLAPRPSPRRSPRSLSHRTCINCTNGYQYEAQASCSRGNPSHDYETMMCHISISLPELYHLTDVERQTILRVLRRDEILRRRNQLRVQWLRYELTSLRRKGAIKVNSTVTTRSTVVTPFLSFITSSFASLWGDDGSSQRACARCRVTLGCLINRGTECRSCRRLVCKACKQYNFSGTDWLCLICYKQMEIQAASGEWMNEFVRRPSRRRDSRVYIPAGDLIKRSIRRSWTISNPQSHSRPFVMSRMSPEMRAYSSLPRCSSSRIVPNREVIVHTHAAVEKKEESKEEPAPRANANPNSKLVVPWSEIIEQRRRQALRDGFQPATSSSSSSRDRSPDVESASSLKCAASLSKASEAVGQAPEGPEKASPPQSSGGEEYDVETLSGAVFHKVTMKTKRQAEQPFLPSASSVRDVEAGRRSCSQTGSEEESSGPTGSSGVGGSPAPSPAAAYLLDYTLDAGKIQPEGDDYKLVFISSDSSSKESNSDVEFATDDCDWDYFEATTLTTQEKPDVVAPEEQQQQPQQVPQQDEVQHKQEIPTVPTSTSLLGSGSFSEHTNYERTNYTQSYLNRHFAPDEFSLPDFYFDRYWSGMYGGNSTEFLRWTGGGVPNIRHPCENCGSDAASLLQGLCTGTNLIPVPVPYPVPVPVPIPFGAEADLAYLDNAIRIKIRSFQPPPPHILLQTSPFGFNWQSILRNENLSPQNAAASWINTEKAEEQQATLHCNKLIQQSPTEGSVSSEKAVEQQPPQQQRDVSTTVVMPTNTPMSSPPAAQLQITPPVALSPAPLTNADSKIARAISSECDMVEKGEIHNHASASPTDIPNHASDNELEDEIEGIDVTANNSGDETSSGDEMQVAMPPNDSSEADSSDSVENTDDENDGHFSQVFIVNPENEEDNVSINSNIASYVDSNEIIGGVQLKHIRQLDTCDEEDSRCNCDDVIVDDVATVDNNAMISTYVELDQMRAELHISEDEATTESSNSLDVAAPLLAEGGGDLIVQSCDMITCDKSTALSERNTTTATHDGEVVCSHAEQQHATEDASNELNPTCEEIVVVTEESIADKQSKEEDLVVTIVDEAHESILSDEPDDVTVPINELSVTDDVSTDTPAHSVLETSGDVIGTSSSTAASTGEAVATTADGTTSTSLAEPRDENSNYDTSLPCVDTTTVVSTIDSDECNDSFQNEESLNIEENTLTVSNEKENYTQFVVSKDDVKAENIEDRVEFNTDVVNEINTDLAESDLTLPIVEVEIKELVLEISDSDDNTDASEIVSCTPAEQEGDNNENESTVKAEESSEVTETITSDFGLNFNEEEETVSADGDKSANKIASDKTSMPSDMILHITEDDLENYNDSDQQDKNNEEGKDYDLVPLRGAAVTSTPAVTSADIATASPASEGSSSSPPPSGAVEPESVSDTQSLRNSVGGYTSYVMITQDGGTSDTTNENPSLSEDERVNVSVIEVSEDEVKINHTNSGDELNPSELLNDSSSGLAGYFTLTLETGVQSASPTPRKPEVKLKKPTVNNVVSEEQRQSPVHNEESVQIVTGEKTMSHAVLCLEEGLADDDSWVEEVDDVESSNLSESSGDEAYMDREEELRGYNRAIDFTLHTILEESCEESEDEAKPSTSAQLKSEDKTELEKYFFFGLGGSTLFKNDGDISDTQSESSVVSDALQEDDVIESKPLDTAELASSRLEKYFLTSFLEPPSADAVSDNTDESGSVGSDSEGKPSPEQRRKKLVRARGAGRHSDRGPDSLAPSDVSGSELPETNDDSTETDSYNDEPNFGVDGLDTVKRKKKKQPSRLSSSTPNISALISSPPIPQIAPEEVQAAAESGSEPEDGAKTPQPDLPADPPPPSRKHHSRDSGFIGSCDDLLRTGPSGSSSGAGSGGSGSDRELETAPAPGESTPIASPAPPSSPVPPLPSDPPPSFAKPSPVPPVRANLARKDSFNNWSSDEETNLMMCKMRAFFKTMVAGGNKNNFNNNNSGANTSSSNNSSSSTSASPTAVKVKPPQLVYFESELTRLMKTVPGIKDEQVREIVEYLSSEDTWSDSYDSSDYTSSDLEGTTFGPRTELQQQISASCQEIIQKFDSSSLSDSTESPQHRDDTFVYQRLVASLSRVASNETTIPTASSPVHNSPPLIAKVMHHIGSRLVALMHEVSAVGDPSALLANSSGAPSPKPRFRRPQRPQQSPTSSSVDESDSPGGSDTERGTAGRMRRHPSLPRSKSHDLGQWQQLLQDAERRGVPRESLRSSSSGVSDLAEEREDYERFSWRGSFESALAADSRTKLSLEAKRRSTGSGSGSASDLFSSSDQLDRRGRVRSCGSIGSRASLPGRGGTRLSSSGGDLLTAAENEGLLDANSRRRGSVPDAITPRSTTLPRSNPAVSASTNSLPRLPLCASPVVAAIHKSYSAHLHVTTPSSTPHHSPHHTHHHHFLQNVKSARYRPPNFRPPPLGPPKRAVSAPGLHHTRRPERRRGTPLGEESIGFLDEPPVSSASLSTPATAHNTPQGGLQASTSNACGSSPAALNKDWSAAPSPEDDIDHLVAIHQQRTNALGARSDSMASVYSGAGESRYGTVAVRGEVEFGLQYNYKAGALEIFVKQCRDLAPVDIKRNRSDPYVKVYLLPDKSKAGKRKTKVKKHTLNPVFNETLKFTLTLHGLETRTLWLTVWHSDMFGRNDFLGEVMMVLENKVFDDPTPNWYPLQDRTEPFEELLSYKGDIIVGLKFVPPDVTSATTSKKSKRSKGALHILVKEAKNLSPAKASGYSDPFCKSYLLPDRGRGSKQKTSITRRTCNPVWNHTFIYDDVSLQELSERALELTIWDHDRLASNEFLGGVRFNLGTGKHYNKSVEWMDATETECNLWQRMLERPGFWVESSLTLRSSIEFRNSTSSTS